MMEESAVSVEESFEIAMADFEIVRSAYPDETTLTMIEGGEVDDCDSSDDEGVTMTTTFPLHLMLHLSETSYMQLEWVQGYPISSNIQVSMYRSKDSIEYMRLERAVHAVKKAAQDCLADGVEGGLVCCAAAFDAWNTTANNEVDNNTFHENGIEFSSVVEKHNASSPSERHSQQQQQVVPLEESYSWMSGEPLVDRKSTFIAHVCSIRTEADVPLALRQLLQSHPKFQRATHNMYAYRLSEKRSVIARGATSRLDEGTDSMTVIWKHDNDDDGEDGAGKRLAHLLEMRNEDGILIVVSRWYGGIQLGPKRFAHITSTAQSLLSHYHNAK